MSGQRDTEERTDKYGGDDGAMEHERAEITPGEDPGTIATLVGKTLAERKQDKDMKTDAENLA
jgi:hypothetical protein